MAGVIVAIGAIVGVTYTLVKYVEIAPAERENARLKSDLEGAQKEANNLKARLKQVESSVSQVNAQSQVPTLLEPAAGTSHVSTQIRFTWSYPKNTPMQPYVVEVVNLREGQVRTFPYQVPSPGKQELTIRNVADLVGLNFWRVRPGTTASRDPIDHNWSRYSDFSFYQSPGDRIMYTKKLRIGTHTLSHPTPFNCRDAGGNRVGFDVELVQWLSQRLGVEPEFIDFDWFDLLRAVKRNDVDLAIGSLTASKKREDEHGIQFSVGYLQSHQAFYALRAKEDFPSSLRGATVAVAPQSTQREAALYLAPQFGFKVKDDYEDYAGIYDDLIAGKVDFALFGKELADVLAGGKYVQYGPVLDEYLTNFYQSHLGRDTEQIALALPAGEGKGQYIDDINRLLSSPEAKEFIETLRRKWLEPATPCRQW